MTQSPQIGPAPPPHVFVVDDDQSARLSVVALLEACEFACRGFESAQGFLREYDPRQAGCLVTDLSMPEKTGLELHSELQHRGWVIPTVVIAGYAEIHQTEQAIQQGVIAVLEKPFEKADLLDSVQLALDADSELRESVQLLMELNRMFSQLTDGENDVLEGLVVGKPDTLIAAESGLSVATVEQRRRHLLKTLNVQSVESIVALVVQRDQLSNGNSDAAVLAEALHGVARRDW